MRQPQVTDFIDGPVKYDREGQYFWITNSKGELKMLGMMRGWGHIQNMKPFKSAGGQIDMESAGKFQDQIGEWIADVINKKLFPK
jgi:hypothetical protein